MAPPAGVQPWSSSSISALSAAKLDNMSESIATEPSFSNTPTKSDAVKSNEPVVISKSVNKFPIWSGIEAEPA